jgi:hypothetical protein
MVQELKVPSPKKPALTVHRVSTLDPPEQGMVVAFKQHVLQVAHADIPARHRQSNQSSMHAVRLTRRHVSDQVRAITRHTSAAQTAFQNPCLHSSTAPYSAYGALDNGELTTGCSVVSRRTVEAHACTCTPICIRSGTAYAINTRHDRSPVHVSSAECHLRNVSESSLCGTAV